MILWGWWCNLRQKQNKVINVGKKWSRNSSNICTLCLVSTWTVLSQPMAGSSTPAVPCCSLGTASCSTRQPQWGWTTCSMERGKNKCASAWICESCCYLCEHRELSFCSGVEEPLGTQLSSLWECGVLCTSRFWYLVRLLQQEGRLQKCSWVWKLKVIKYF